VRFLSCRAISSSLVSRRFLLTKYSAHQLTTQWLRLLENLTVQTRLAKIITVIHIFIQQEKSGSSKVKKKEKYSKRN